ncbi:GNAT family N-acetyltransferase [Aquabacterium sp. A7-Y]|uniref:GNAT family N-acetyltransferase n=1 Tax=Aquabacterium sp. A7-Y TaxID=1349605 RepID=UPI00223D6C4E|nr:GNAT family N-acetyltransferase [Aquabacterium sp. A7-Y]MCW7541579.1 GNAT family N-acetyltransferase [Aquabacterium sp. A7-Y]
MAPRILAATEVHLPGITTIYNDAVLNTTAIWNDQVVDLENRAAWLAQRRSIGYPVLVAVGPDEKVLGYASFGDFRAFDGYRYTVENSVYVKSDARRGGVAMALMTRLIEEARSLGKHQMVAAIESGNAGSIRLHERLGFEHGGHMSEVGTKFGRWLDLTWMQLRLNERQPPA